jgi:hypothetical protein
MNPQTLGYDPGPLGSFLIALRLRLAEAVSTLLYAALRCSTLFDAALH